MYGKRILSPKVPLYIQIFLILSLSLSLSLSFLFSTFLFNTPFCHAQTADDNLEVINDTYQNATVVEPGVYTSLKCMDDDWYRVSVPDLGALQQVNLKVTIQFLNSNGDLDLDLYPADLSPNPFNYLDVSGLTGNIEVVASSVPPGDYLIKVYKWYGTENPYEMRIEFVYPCQDIPYEWVAIGTEGQGISLGDNAFQEIDIGFDFTFYGQTHNRIKVSSNGYLTFSDMATESTPLKPSHPNAPPDSIFVYWADLRPDLGGEILYTVDQSNPDCKRLIVEWKDVPQDASGEGITFQAVLYECTNQIVISYQDVVFGSPNDTSSLGREATVGTADGRKTEDSTKRIATKYLYQEARLNNQQSILFAPSMEGGLRILHHDPSNGSHNVSLNRQITVSFSQPLVENTVQGVFSISPAVTGAWNVTGNLVVFDHTAEQFLSDTNYTVTIDLFPIQDVFGNFFSDAVYTFSFNTMTDTNIAITPPKVFSTSPEYGATDVPTGSDIVITFDQVMDTDTPDLCFLIPEVQGTWTITDAGSRSVVTFQHQTAFDPDTPYYVTISGTAKAFDSGAGFDGDGDGTSEGSPVDDFTFIFTSAPTQNSDQNRPQITISGVACGAIYNINVTPSVTPVIEITDANLDINNTYIQLNWAPYISGTLITEAGEYTLYVFAKDLGGLTSTVTCSFNLVSVVPPTITVTNPVAGASNVAINSNIVITFDQIMDPNTPAACSIFPEVTGTWTMENIIDQSVVTFQHQNVFTPDTDYFVTIAGTAQALASGLGFDGDGDGIPEGSPVDSYTFIFTTAPTQIVDNTPPVIAISGVQNGTKYNINVTPSITPVIQITDENINNAGTFITLNGITYTSGTPVSQPGNYILFVVAQDLAGNQNSKTYLFSLAPPPFVLQTTPAANATNVARDSLVVVEFDQVMENSATSYCSISPSIEGIWTQQTIDSKTRIEFQHTAAFDPNTTYTVIVSGTVQSLLYEMGLDGNGDGSPQGSPSDDFSFAFTASPVQITDQDPPVITISGVDDDTLYSHPVIIDIQISDDNPDPGQEIVKLNGVSIPKSYTVSTDGEYTLAVTAYDLFSNGSVDSLSFSIDQTPPEIVIEGVVCGEEYSIDLTPQITPVITITDAHIGISTIRLNGNAYTSGTPITSAGDYTISVSASDLAGNTGSKTCSFSITEVPPQQGWTTLWPYDPPISRIISSLFIDGNMNLWIGGIPEEGNSLVGGGVCRHNLYTGEWICLDETDDLAGKQVEDIASGPQWEIWIATSPDPNGEGAGLTKYSPSGEFKPYGPADLGLTDNDLWITDIEVDSNGYLWVATAFFGIFRFDGTDWINYSTSGEDLFQGESIALTDDFITSLSLGPQGELLIGTSSDGLFIKNQNGNSVHFSVDLTGWYITEMAFDLDGTLWMVSENGLMTLGSDWLSPIIPNGLPQALVNTVINDLSVDPLTGKLYVSTDNGFFVYDGQGWLHYDTDNSGIPSMEVNTVIADPFGDLWVGTENGLAHFNKTAPTLISVYGQNQGTTKLPVGTAIYVTFSEPMDRQTAQSAFEMIALSNGSTITGTFTWNYTSSQMTFKPSNSLSKGDSYQIRIRKTATDREGLAIDLKIGEGDDFRSFTITTEPKEQKPQTTNPFLPFGPGYIPGTTITFPSLTGLSALQSMSNYYRPQISLPITFNYSMVPSTSNFNSSLIHNTFQPIYWTGKYFQLPNTFSNVFLSSWTNGNQMQYFLPFSNFQK